MGEDAVIHPFQRDQAIGRGKVAAKGGNGQVCRAIRHEVILGPVAIPFSIAVPDFKSRKLSTIDIHAVTAKGKEPALWTIPSVSDPMNFAIPTGERFQPLNRDGLVDRVANLLAEAIMAGRIRPGARLSESTIARDMGVSRAPVREAARLLESSGLVEYHTNRGFLCRPFRLLRSTIFTNFAS